MTSEDHRECSSADASKKPMSLGEQGITAAVSTTKPAPANIDAWKSQEKGAGVDQKYEELKARYDELRSQFDELKSHNEILRAERGAWECKYKDLLKIGTESTETSGDLARMEDAAALQTADVLKVWTEKEPNDMKRRVEAGLSRLIQDCEDQITRPVDTDAAWPRPLGDLENAGGNLGNYAQLFPSHMRRLVGSFYQITGFCMQPFSWARATIVPDPSSLPERIYEHLFGSETHKSWQIEAKASVRRGLLGTEFLRAVLGAAVHEMVFTKPVPWATASDWLEKLGPVAPYLTAALRRKGCLKLKMDDVLWLALRTQIDNATFQNRVVMPRAKLLADTLQLALRPQLELLRITGSKEVSDHTFWNETSAELTEMFMNALILKGSLDASPFEYEFSWIPAGKEFVYTEMERPIGSPPGEKAIIAAATTPKLKIRCPSYYAYPWRVCCKAHVAFRPSEAS